VARTELGGGVAKEAMELVKAQHDAVELECELIGIERGSEVALANRDPRGLRELVDPVLAGTREGITRGTWAVVELGARSDEETASGALPPGDPTFE
jgi:hypothetical protein